MQFVKKDFSSTNAFNGDNSNVLGGHNNVATKDNSTALGGVYNTASAVNSIASGGTYNTASGDNSSVSGGTYNLATGDNATIYGGVYNFAKSYGESSGGIYGTDYAPSSATVFAASDRIFNIGIGTSTSARADAITILKNGLVTLPSATNSLISVAGAKAVVTKEYADATYANFKTTPPLSATDTGKVGEIRVTPTFIYYCVAVNIWVRMAVTTW